MKFRHELTYDAPPADVFEMLADPKFREAACTAQDVISADVQIVREGPGFTMTIDQEQRTEDLPVGFLVRGACKTDPGDEVIAAYDAPYPDAPSKAGARAFPLMLPRTPDAPGAQAGQRVLEALREDRRPTLMLWGDSDPVLPLSVGERFAESIGREAPRPIENASHFLQEDQGPLIGSLIADWLVAG